MIWQPMFFFSKRRSVLHLEPVLVAFWHFTNQSGLRCNLAICGSVAHPSVLAEKEEVLFFLKNKHIFFLHRIWIYILYISSLFLWTDASTDPAYGKTVSLLCLQFRWVAPSLVLIQLTASNLLLHFEEGTLEQRRRAVLNMDWAALRMYRWDWNITVRLCDLVVKLLSVSVFFKSVFWEGCECGCRPATVASRLFPQLRLRCTKMFP